MSGVLQVRNLTKRYFGTPAVSDLSFDVRAGSITGLIGPNGSGKSTTIDCISGFQAADGGTWRLGDADLTGAGPERHAMAGLVRTFQNVRTYESLTLLENLLAAGQAYRPFGIVESFLGSARLREAEAAARATAHDTLEMVGLAAYADAPAEVLSYGQRKLLAIAAAVVARPRLVILDEPVAGINPTMILRIEALVRRLNQQGTTLLIVEHNMDFIMSLCERVIVLVAGRLLTEGAPADIQRDPRVLEAYLGADTAP